MVMHVDNTFCGNQFTIYTHIKSLCCTPKTNTMFQVNYAQICQMASAMSDSS